jgi:hypothetical protein
MGRWWRSMSGSSKIKRLDQIIIDGKEYDKVLFIHIPKTGGSSISNFIDTTTLDTWKKGKIHMHYSYDTAKVIENVPEDAFKFAVVRDPFTRAYSYYKHFNKINKINYTINDFLNVVEGTESFKDTPLVQFTQSYYLYSEGKNQMNKTYHFEKLKEFETDFGAKLGKDNKGLYTKEEYNRDYTNKIINRVLDIYEEDFVNFGYSTEFRR